MMARRQQEPKISKIKLILWTILALLVMGTLVWWLFFSSFFKINDIQIADTRFADKGVIADTAWKEAGNKSLLFLPHDSILLYNKDKVADSLHDLYFFEKLNIVKDFNHTVHIDFVETDYDFNWLENDSVYLISDQGEIILNPAEPKPELIKVVNSAEALKEGRFIQVPPDYLIDAAKLDSGLESGTYGLTDRYFVYDKTPKTIKIQIEEGPILLFSRALDFDLQIVKLNSLRQHELREGAKFNAQSRIDLRYGEKVYFE